jgi:hypothetical protein
MSRKISLSVTAAFGFASIILACSAAPDENVSDNSEQGVTGTPHGGAHIMPLHKPGELSPFSAPAGAHLTYYGGPVISSVKIYTVFWGSSVPNQSDLNQFYTDITKSAYFDWLSEYNTPSQTIGEGSFGGSVVDTSPPSGNVTDAQIQSEITKLINAGKLPANDANNLYMVHFPAGVTITMADGSQSCVVFCAYHGTYTLNGKDVFYGVMPDLSGGCAGGCGTNPTKLQNQTEVASHEMIEATTDPAVGLATTNGPPLGWYDQTNGEIGDICNGQAGQVGNWTVQKEFSNAASDCITTKPGVGDGGTDADADADADADSGGGTCAHSDCTSGTKLTSGCDPCVTKICAADPYCCNTKWDSVCVGEVSSVCGASCSGGGDGGTDGGTNNCSHAICKSGKKLTKSCDPCVTKVCTSDPYCCSTLWDNICVGEVGSICGETCN